MPLSAGVMRERYAIEAPTENRNELGESVQEWEEIAQVWGSYQAVSYSEQSRRGQVGGSISAIVRIRYYPGLQGTWRLRWISRDDRILWISGVVERGNREEHELDVQEAAA